MNGRGFTLVECLIAMALALVVITSSLQFFGLAQKIFFRLKASEEAGQGALAALDKMRIDLLHAGQGLAGEMGLGLVEAAEALDSELRTISLERTLTLAADAGAGDTRLIFASTAGIARGQDICLCDGAAGEVRTVAAVDGAAVVLEAPLQRAYPRHTASVALLERVVYFLDAPARILRRRVNAAAAQPLLENVAAAAWRVDPQARLARIRLELNIQGESAHEAPVFLKNPALARPR